MDLPFNFGILCSMLSVAVSSMYNFDVEHTLHRADDGYSSPQMISNGFVFFGMRQTRLYVCHNGILSFGSGLSSWSPTPFPISPSPLIASFWGDVDTNRGGAIYYGELNESQLTIASNDIYPDLVPTWGFSARWFQVGGYGGGRCCNTFEAILVTDGELSFVIYNFQDIGWTTSSASSIPAQCGFVDGRSTDFWSHEWSRTGGIQNLPSDSNCGVTGRFIFRVDQVVIAPYEDIDECSSSPCNNNGICLDSLGDFTCQCESGWTGSVCGTDVDECNSDPCNNGGICIDGISDYTCQCVSGWTGVLCETDICQSDPCEHGGTCVKTDDGYVCICPSGRAGSTCQNEDNDLSKKIKDLTIGLSTVAVLFVAFAITMLCNCIAKRSCYKPNIIHPMMNQGNVKQKYINDDITTVDL